MATTSALGGGKVRRPHGKRGSETEPVSLRVLEIAGTGIVLAVLLIASIGDWSEVADRWMELLPWLVVIALADLLPVPIWGSVELMMSFPVLLSAALVFPPYVAGGLSFVATVDARVFRGQIGPLRDLFNRSNVAASVMTASWIFHQFDVSVLDWPEVLPAVFVALVADVLVNFTLVILGTHLLTGVDAWELLRNVYGGSHPEVFLGGYACFGLVAILMATTYATAGTAGLIAFAVPLLLARQMFLHWKRLGEANNAIERKDRALSIVASRVADERRDERLALAAGIHDEVLPPLYKVHLMGQVVKHDFASGRLLDLEADVPDLLQAVDSADTALRDLVHDLRNSRIGPGGLLETLKLAVRDAESQTNARVDLQAEPIRGSALTHLLVYQLVKEALANAIKHSRARVIKVVLREDDQAIRLSVDDDGCGFDLRSVDQATHFGLQIMRERTEIAGGEMAVDSRPGEGTHVVVRLPIDDMQDD
ncbi:MAG TPA: ATP-binding protein [Actinomycetota bacterium]|nr:ATP-binding protein [Actinomycetota bacterium]